MLKKWILVLCMGGSWLLHFQGGAAPSGAGGASTASLCTGYSAHCSYIQLSTSAWDRGTAEVLSIFRHLVCGLCCECPHQSFLVLPNIWKLQVSGIPFPSGDHLYTISMLAVILFPDLLNDWQEWGGQEKLFLFICLYSSYLEYLLYWCSGLLWNN